jgi:hypothetical protein
MNTASFKRLSSPQFGSCSGTTSAWTDMNHFMNRSENLVICADQMSKRNQEEIKQHSPELGLGKIVIVITSKNFSVDVLLNQEVYFFNHETGMMEEKYMINGIMVHNALFKVDKEKIMSNVTQSFLTRRSDFKGITLKLVMAEQPPLLMLKPGTNTIHNELINKVQEHQLTGSYHVLTTQLSQEMNWTASRSLFYGSDWGSYDSKSGAWSGLIGLTQRGKADVIGTSFDLTAERFQVLDYLTPMTETKMTIIINKDTPELHSWTMFMKPLSWLLWVAVLCNSIAYSVTLIFMQNLKNNKHSTLAGYLGEVPKTWWCVFITSFGKSLNLETQRSTGSWRLLIFLTCLSGNIIFMAYKASLTTQLSLRFPHLPFHNLEQLSETDYRFSDASPQVHIPSIFITVCLLTFRLVIDRNVSYYIKQFENAMPETIEGRVYKNNMKGSNYLSPVLSEVAKLIRGDPKIAFMGTSTLFHSMKDYSCHLTKAWESDTPTLLSLALPKGSPYTIFLFYQQLKLLESGLHRTLDSQVDRVCANEKRNFHSIGMYKTAGAFMFLAASYCLSAVIGLIEGQSNLLMSG